MAGKRLSTKPTEEGAVTSTAPRDAPHPGRDADEGQAARVGPESTETGQDASGSKSTAPKKARKASRPTKKKRKKKAKARKKSPKAKARPRARKKARAKAAQEDPDAPAPVCRETPPPTDNPEPGESCTQPPVPAGKPSKEKALDLRAIAKTLEPTERTGLNEPANPDEPKQPAAPEIPRGAMDASVEAEGSVEFAGAALVQETPAPQGEAGDEREDGPGDGLQDAPPVAIADAASLEIPAPELPLPCPVEQAAEESGSSEGPRHEEVVELSPEEALDLLASLSVSRAGQAPVDRFPGGEPPAVRVLTFESAEVDPDMRVAGPTLARLCEMVGDREFSVALGPMCQTLGAFIAEWDNTPPEVPVAILANLNGAGEFLSGVARERPGVASAFWIVFETLRSRFSSSTTEFLAELRRSNRLRAIGHGPRNIVEAARRGANAMRGHVEWGFGRTGPAADFGLPGASVPFKRPNPRLGRAAS